MRLKFKNKIKDFRVVHSLIRNWLDVILFRLKIKRKFTMILNDGSKIRIVNRKDYFEFFSGMKFKEFQLKALSLKKKNSTLSFNYNGKTLIFRPKEKEQDIYDLIIEEFIDHIYKHYDYKISLLLILEEILGTLLFILL